MNRVRFIQCLTASRIVLASGVAVIMTSRPGAGWLWLALFLLVVMELSDILDGNLARRWKLVTEFGKMFDPYADAVSRLIVFWSLAQAGYCWSVVPLVMAVRDVTVAYVRATKSGVGKDVAARWPGKLKAVVHGVTAIALLAVAVLFPEWSPHLVVPASILVMFFSIAALLDHLNSAWSAILGKLE